jgi:hypothetical protein
LLSGALFSAPRLHASWMKSLRAVYADACAPFPACALNEPSPLRGPCSPPGPYEGSAARPDPGRRPGRGQGPASLSVPGRRRRGFLVRSGPVPVCGSVGGRKVRSAAGRAEDGGFPHPAPVEVPVMAEAPAPQTAPEPPQRVDLAWTHDPALREALKDLPRLTRSGRSRRKADRQAPQC